MLAFDPEGIVLSAQAEGLGMIAAGTVSLKGSFKPTRAKRERPLQADGAGADVFQAFGLG
jgi:hypothetical protein